MWHVGTPFPPPSSSLKRIGAMTGLLSSLEVIIRVKVVRVKWCTTCLWNTYQLVLAVSFGSVILCKIQVVDQLWLDSSELKVKNVWQISLVCWWNSFSLLKLFNFYGIKPLPLLVLVSKVVKKTKAWNIQLNILCLILFIFQDDWVLLRWINATL